jgi:hypothetical protein
MAKKTNECRTWSACGEAVTHIRRTGEDRNNSGGGGRANAREGTNISASDIKTSAKNVAWRATKTAVATPMKLTKRAQATRTTTTATTTT